MTDDPDPSGPTTHERATRPCEAVQDELARSDRFREAQDIHAELRERGARVGLATVYRTLQALVESRSADVLRLTSGTAVYRLCSMTHHHNLVCRRCGRAVEVQAPTVERWAERMAHRHGFTHVTHALELWGVCATCLPPTDEHTGGGG